MKKQILKILILGLLAGVMNIPATNSYFTAQVSVSGTITTGDWTPPEVTWVTPEDGDIKSGVIELQAVCDGTGSESQYINFWWYKASEGQTVTGDGSAKENDQYHYVRRSDSEADVEGDTFSWELDTKDESLIRSDLDWDGEWRLRAACKDAYGNYAHSEIDIVVDNTAPEVEITNPSDGDYVRGEIEVRGTVTDDNPDHYWLVAEEKESGDRVSDFPGVVNESSSVEDELLHTWDTADVDDGEYIIKLEARDVVGNKDPDQAPVSEDPEVSGDSVDWITVVVDNTPPEVEITKPDDGDVVSGLVKINGTVIEKDLSHYNISVYPGDADVWDFGERLEQETVYGSAFENKEIYEWNTTGYSDGDYQIRLAARDLAGNRDPMETSGDGDSVDVITVTVDNVPSKPEGLTIYQGHGEDKEEVECGGVTNSTEITIEWLSNPEDDVDYYWFGTQFNTKHRKVYAPENYYEGNMTPGHNPYYYTIIAVDEAGNESSVSDECALTLDRPPTVPELEWPIDDDEITNNKPLMQWSDSSDDNEVVGYYYRIYIGSPDGTVWPDEGSLFSENSEYQAGVTGDNDYYWQVRAEDNNGNLSAWSDLEHFVIDTT